MARPVRNWFRRSLAGVVPKVGTTGSQRGPRNVVAGLVLLGIAGGLGAVTGVVWGGVGLALVALWYLVPVPIVVGIAQLVLLVHSPWHLPTLAAFEAGLAVVLLAGATDGHQSLRTLVAATLSIGILVAVVLTGRWQAIGYWSVAGLLVAIAGVIAYGLHRYELVEMGLVEDNGGG